MHPVSIQRKSLCRSKCTKEQEETLPPLQCRRLVGAAYSMPWKSPSFHDQRRTQSLASRTFNPSSYISLRDNRSLIPPDPQIRPTLTILNHQPLFIRQMQQADKTIARRDVLELLLRVGVSEVVHDLHEMQVAVLVGGQRGSWRSRRRWWWLRCYRILA